MSGSGLKVTAGRRARFGAAPDFFSRLALGMPPRETPSRKARELLRPRPARLIDQGVDHRMPDPVQDPPEGFIRNRPRNLAPDSQT